ncbi:DUF2802 domain-containing protein [Vibrio vulnificus]|uniref:DUF2802 domain-containing protein n=1 Tax=Vibrio vulnificus TaxID=672 RepID=A0ABX4WUH0_VIBVL|nr:DUF2802 domain-containing protein [Vibrio vulnificus]EGQ9935930.1 DUF2802 domain-containing protein [Vibrio vulnificus]EGR0051281.1 DUF2802 domain-containing protein [Vibrio vulnificus]EID4374183.1 DUF2802 domain-containing protein [Vibrio vulnificus]KHF83148.1 DNA repair protein [Vibrio vulnificus]KHF85334.1 DNA repair protein [Vibrio vulnificus]
MVEMFSNSPALLVGAGLFVLLLLVVLQLRIKATLQTRLDSQGQKLRSSEKELQKANKQLLEVRSVVIGLGQRVSEQQEIIQHLTERVVELEQADTDGRLYTRASKMVQLGADVNELIKECELPKAEAELMLSLQKKIAGKEKIPPLSSQLPDLDETAAKKAPTRRR